MESGNSNPNQITKHTPPAVLLFFRRLLVSRKCENKYIYSEIRNPIAKVRPNRNEGNKEEKREKKKRFRSINLFVEIPATEQ